MSSDSRKRRKQRLEREIAEREARRYVLVDLTIGTTKAGNQYVEPQLSMGTMPAGTVVDLDHQFSMDSIGSFVSHFKVYHLDGDGVLYLRCPDCEQYKKRLFAASLGRYYWICGDCLKSSVQHIVGSPPATARLDMHWCDNASQRRWHAYIWNQQLESDRATLAEWLAEAQQHGDQRRIADVQAWAERLAQLTEVAV